MCLVVTTVKLPMTMEDNFTVLGILLGLELMFLLLVYCYLNHFCKFYGSCYVIIYLMRRVKNR